MIQGAIPERLQKWLDTLPEYSEEIEGNPYVIVTYPVDGVSGIVARYNNSSHTIARVRPQSANMSYRVNGDGVMTHVWNMTGNQIRNATAPDWTIGYDYTIEGLQTNMVRYKLTSPITWGPTP